MDHQDDDLQPEREEEFIQGYSNARGRTKASVKEYLQTTISNHNFVARRVETTQYPYYDQAYLQRGIASAMVPQPAYFQTQPMVTAGYDYLYPVEAGFANEQMHQINEPAVMDSAERLMLERAEQIEELSQKFEALMQNVKLLVHRYGPRLESRQMLNEGLRFLRKLIDIRQSFDYWEATTTELDDQIINLRTLLIQAELEVVKFEEMLSTEELAHLIVKWIDAAAARNRGGGAEPSVDGSSEHIK